MENVVISAHCHNDLGLAVANAMAAVAAGARQVECTINGIGERAGNASLEEIVMATRVRPDRYPYETGIVSEQLYPVSQMLGEITGVPVQPNKAIVGRNAFAHEAGIHQDGMLKNPLTYEIMTPKSVGVPDSKLVLGSIPGGTLWACAANNSVINSTAASSTKSIAASWCWPTRSSTWPIIICSTSSAKHT